MLSVFQKTKSPCVVSNCLSVLVALAEHQFGCSFIPVSGIAKNLFCHLYTYVDEVHEEKWTTVFLLCLNLNSKLLRNLKHDYLDEALGFWGQYSAYLNQRLINMSNVTEICVGVDDTEKGYNAMKTILQASTYVLYDVHMLVPYINNWQALQPNQVYRAIVSFKSDLRILYVCA